MNTTLKVGLVGALWLLYSLLIYRGCYNCLSEAACAGCGVEQTAAAAAVAAAPSTARLPLDFKWSDAAPYTNPGFDSLKASVLAGKTNDNVLEIVGYYFEDEPKPEGFPNMGMARATKIREQFFSDLSDDRVQIRARVVSEREGVRDGYFASADFKWVAPHTTAETVEKLDDRILIRFPYNSVEKDYDPSVDTYLDQLAAQLKSGSGQVRLIGHTDDKGEEEANEMLGLRRAKMIRDILVRKGVKRSQIITESRGENQPTAPNNNEEGRHNNRRVEVIVQ